MILLHSFVIALNFLTRISIIKTQNWKADDFSKSVKFFPLIGGILGLLYGCFDFIILFNDYFVLPPHIFSALLIFIIFYLSGPLFFDGFMDTMDGIFSGREREKILEIMKDSRVGANAVITFGIYLILLYGAFLDIDKNIIVFSLLSATVISHFMVVVSILFFPYARKEGIGKMFEVNNKISTFLCAVFFVVAFIFPCGLVGLIALLLSLIFTVLFNKYLANILGGLTGDTYGCVAVISFLLTQIIFAVFNDFFKLL